MRYDQWPRRFFNFRIVLQQPNSCKSYTFFAISASMGQNSQLPSVKFVIQCICWFTSKHLAYKLVFILF